MNEGLRTGFFSPSYLGGGEGGGGLVGELRLPPGPGSAGGGVGGGTGWAAPRSPINPVHGSGRALPARRSAGGLSPVPAPPRPVA